MINENDKVWAIRVGIRADREVTYDVDKVFAHKNLGNALLYAEGLCNELRKKHHIKGKVKKEDYKTVFHFLAEDCEDYVDVSVLPKEVE